MANAEQLAILKSGAEVWNLWRRDHLEVPVDLSGARLEEATLDRANLTHAVLKDAKLVETSLSKANLDGADLTGAWLMGAYLNRATLRGADCGRANLNGANLNKADLSGATFAGADLSFVRLVGTRLHGAVFNGCRIYGISAWDLDLDEHTQQSDLIITPDTQPAITVDNLKVAQFLYLIIQNKEIRDVIDTITSKVVLILGRFTPERKAVLDALRAALAAQTDAQGNRRYITVMFDFAKPDSQDYLQPVTTIAHLARFVVADFTDSKIVNAEVSAIAGEVTLPILPLLQAGSPPEYLPGGWAAQYRGVLETYHYQDQDSLIAGLADQVIAPVEAKRAELQRLLHALP